MSFFKNLLIEAEDCGFAGVSANETYVHLKDKYSWAAFDGEDFRLDGPVYLAWEKGHHAYYAEQYN